MMEGTETVVTETPQAPPPEAPLSIADHASQFGPGAKREERQAEPVEPAETPVEPAAPKPRHRAQSQKAGPEDVPRIRELTAKARAAEERAAALEAELQTFRQQPRQEPRPEPKPEPRAQAKTDDDPEPNESDPKYASDYGAYLVDKARWAARDEWRKRDAASAEQATRQKKEQEQRAFLKTFGERMEAAKKRYDDFDTVALAPTRIPKGGPIDAFILEDDNGPDVLYHLQQHTDELDALVAMPVLAQVKRLALLSQRYDPASPTQPAGTNGAVAGVRTVVLPPKPPTPLRTEASRASGTPPPTDGSLSIAEHAKAFGRKR